MHVRPFLWDLQDLKSSFLLICECEWVLLDSLSTSDWWVSLTERKGSFENFVTPGHIFFKIMYLFIFGCVESLLLHGLSLAEVCGLLMELASLVAVALGTQASVVAASKLSSWVWQALEHRLSNCVALALVTCSMGDLPGPGTNPCLLHW